MAERFFFALRLGDAAKLEGLLSSDCRLKREQSGTALSGAAVVPGLLKANAGLLAQDEPQPLRYRLFVENPWLPMVQADVDGSSAAEGRWALFFSTRHPGKIEEIRLPPAR